MIGFDTWWQRFLHCAEMETFEIDVSDKELYQEYYDDGDSPEEALLCEIRAKGYEEYVK